MNLRNIRPAILRLLVLVVIGIPCFSYWPFSIAKDTSSFAFLAIWLAYDAVLSLLIIRSVGINYWLQWFAASCVLAIVTVAFTVTYLQVRETVGYPPHNPDKSPYVKAQWSADQVKKGLMIITVVPYAIFVTNSFSVAAGVSRVARWAGRKRRMARHVLLALRVIQHVIEVLPPLLQIWREEHPDVLRPRMRRDMQGKLGGIKCHLEWWWVSVEIWTKATLVYALEPVPVFCHTIETFFAAPPEPGAIVERRP